MKGYSSEIPENCAKARLEGVNASYKDLVQVCGVIRSKKTDWAVEFLEKAAEGEVPVFFRTHNKNLGHRRELGGRKGRYPKKAASIVLKLLNSAISNGRVLGLGDSFTILSATANKKDIYPRMAPKGRSARSYLETSRVELVLKSSGVPKGVTVAKPPVQAKAEKEVKPGSNSKTEKTDKQNGEKVSTQKDNVPAPTSTPSPQELAKAANTTHKHETEKAADQTHSVGKEQKPHQHAEHDKR